MPKKISRKRREDLERFDSKQSYQLDEALNILESFSKSRFDESVTLDINLGIDPRKQDQNIRGAISMPNGTGKTARVICFAEGAVAEKAKAAGAVEVGAQDLIKKVEGGWLDFDVAVSTPDQMRHVGKLGKVLGPQGKMPSPKAGTVTTDVETAVREFTAGKVEFRADAGGSVHIIVGKRSFSKDKLSENINFFLQHIKALRPSSIKKEYMQKVCLSGTMTPSIKLHPQAFN